MIETGILTPEDKVELLENYVVLKMPRNPSPRRHHSTIEQATRSLVAAWLGFARAIRGGTHRQPTRTRFRHRSGRPRRLHHSPPQPNGCQHRY